MTRIAIVDDNEAWGLALALRLQQQDYAASAFSNADAFLSQMDQFDLVLVDFSIPSRHYQRRMDGPEIICHVKQHLKHPPVLVLISSFFIQGLANAADLCPEADAVLSKQVETTELLTQIRQLLINRPRSKHEDNFTQAHECRK